MNGSFQGGGGDRAPVSAAEPPGFMRATLETVTMAGAGEQQGNRDLTDHLRPFAGLGQGISAFVVGYVVVTGLWFIDAAVAGTYTGFGGLVYGGLERLLASHLGAADALVSDRATAAVPTAAYALVPVLLLGYNGWGIASRYGAQTGRAAAIGGASTAVGYAVAVVGSVAALTLLVESLLGALGVQVVTGGLAYTSPSLRVLLVAGMLYPLVFGGLGGYVSYRWRNRDT